MKIFILTFSILFLASCSNPTQEEYTAERLDGIQKYVDGNITCYSIRYDTLSCVNTSTTLK